MQNAAASGAAAPPHDQPVPDQQMQVPGRSGPRHGPDDGRPKARRMSSLGETRLQVQHGSAEHGPGQDAFQTPAATPPATPRGTSRRRESSQETSDVLPAFGQRLLRCEQWIGKLDEHCDQGGIAGFKNLQHAVTEMARMLVDLDNRVTSGDQQLSQHLERYLMHDRVLDQRLQVLEQDQGPLATKLKGLKPSNKFYRRPWRQLKPNSEYWITTVFNSGATLTCCRRKSQKPAVSS